MFSVKHCNAINYQYGRKTKICQAILLSMHWKEGSGKKKKSSHKLQVSRYHFLGYLHHSYGNLWHITLLVQEYGVKDRWSISSLQLQMNPIQDLTPTCRYTEKVTDFSIRKLLIYEKYQIDRHSSWRKLSRWKKLSCFACKFWEKLSIPNFLYFDSWRKNKKQKYY